MSKRIFSFIRQLDYLKINAYKTLNDGRIIYKRNQGSIKIKKANWLKE